MHDQPFRKPTSEADAYRIAQQITAHNRALYGGWTMTAAATEPPAGQQTQPPPASAPTDGFPADKPVAEMTSEQQAAYWKHQARKHEGRVKDMADYDTIKKQRDDLLTASQTDAEKAVTAARAEGETSGEAKAASRYAAQLVAAKVEAALAAKGVKPDAIAGHVEFLDHTKFLTATGEVDTDKVTTYASGITPGAQWPSDMGQGHRGQNKPATGVAAGRDLYDATHNKPTP